MSFAAAISGDGSYSVYCDDKYVKGGQYFEGSGYVGIGTVVYPAETLWCDKGNGKYTDEINYNNMYCGGTASSVKITYDIDSITCNYTYY